MRVLEVLELQAQEGPCLDCFRTGEPVVNQDLDTSIARWPQFAPAALAAGFRTVHALPMRLRGTVLGGLNLFSVDAHHIDPSDLEAAQALADVATIALLQHRATHEAQVLNEQLSHALNTRIVIEQSKGIIAEREGVAIEEAFGLLRGHARNHNLLLADVARGVIAGTVNVVVTDRR